MDERKLEEQIKQYQELAKENKKIDVAGLMINALEREHANKLPFSQKRWAYLISIAIPPFGLIFALVFYFSGKDDGAEAAWICVTLTAVSILFLILFTKLLFSGSGVDPRSVPELIEGI